MATLTSQLIVSLIDKVTGPSRAVSAALNGLRAAQDRNNVALASAQARMLGAVGAAYALGHALAAPISAAKDFQTTLSDIRQKSGLSTIALKELDGQIRAIAGATNQLPSDTAKTFDALLGLGLGGKTDAENVEAAIKLLPAINKTAAAFRAESEDVMRAGQAVFANLKVPAEQVQLAFDMMAASGNAGAFELRDMAQYFPSITAQAQALGVKGTKGVADIAAALQVVRQGAGDASEAATNMRDLFSQMLSPRLAGNFKKFGIDMRASLAQASEQGVSPIDAIIEMTRKAMANGASIGDLFRNQQSMLAMQALLADTERYHQIREEAAGASGLVEEEYAKRIQDADAAIIRFKASIENLNIALGRGLLPVLTGVIDNGIIPLVNAVSRLASEHPRLAAAVVAVTSGFIGLRIAATAAQFAFLWMKGGVLTAAIAGLRGLASAGQIAAFAFTPVKAAMAGLRSTMIGFAAAGAIGGPGAAFSAMASSLLGLLNPLRLVTSAMRVLKVALIGSGIGAVLVGIAIAGAWIYNNWTGISTAFEAFKGAFMRAIEPVMPALRPVLDGIQWLSDTISSIVGPIDEMGGGWAKAGLAAGKFVGETVKAIVELPGKIIGFAGDMMNSGVALAQSLWDGITTKVDEGVAWFSGLPSRIAAVLGTMFETGIALAQSLWDGVSAKIDEMIAWFSGLPSRIIAAIGSIDIGSLIKWPTPPAWLSRLWGGGGTPSGNANPDAGRAVSTMLDGMGKRASGGPVRAGLPYLVGERGPELFIPDVLGAVVPNHALSRSSTRAPANVNVTVSLGGIHGVSDPETIAARVVEITSRKLREAMSGIQSDVEYSPGL